MLIFAHRGFSGRQPEMTRAAYAAAIEWSEQTDVELGLECDVHFSADDELICLHDLTLDRTCDASGPAFARTLAELRTLDFGGWWGPVRSADQRAMVTLADLLAMVDDARTRGVEVNVAIETKHPNPRGLEIEERVAEMLGGYGWDRAGSPVRLISFDLPALDRLQELLPELERTLLIEKSLHPWSAGRLPDGVRVVGPDLALLRGDPGFVGRARGYGNDVHAWTVNTPQDVAFCLDLGVTGITTDCPDVVVEVLGESGQAPG